MSSPASNGSTMSGVEHLVQMANDIGNFFRSEPKREDAIAGIANHIAKFWTRRMREKLNAHLKPITAPTRSMSCRARRCAASPKTQPRPRRPEPHGGDG